MTYSFFWGNKKGNSILETLCFMPKINRKLTEQTIKAAKPKDRPYYLYDTEGLRLQVRPSGKKLWHYKYLYLGKSNTFSIGKYGVKAGEIPSPEARKRCAQVKELLNKGLDPNKYKKEQKSQILQTSENSFESIAREWYSKQSWSTKHAKNILSRLEKDVFIIVGRKPIKEINVRDILSILDKIEKRGALDVAKRINQYCSLIFDYAIIKGICDNNPAAGRAKYIKTRKAKHFPHLQDYELSAFLKRLNIHSSTQMKLAIELLVLTFVRPGELRFAEWREFDLEKKEWLIPCKRMKKNRDHIVPLSKQAIEVIKKLRKSRLEGEVLLFPGMKTNKPFSDVALIKAVKRLSNGKAVPHGMRHTASTILNENSFNSDYIEKQLAHVEENKVRGTYNKAEYLGQRHKMMQWWADYLEEKKNG